MIRRLLDSFTLALLLGLAIVAALACAEPAQQLPLVKADFPVCIRITPGPLIAPRHRLSGQHFSETV